MQEVFPYSFRYDPNFKKLYFLLTTRELTISNESCDNSYGQKKKKKSAVWLVYYHPNLFDFLNIEKYRILNIKARADCL